MNNKIVAQNIVPVFLALGLIFSISTNLRLAIFPIGPGEIFLALSATLGIIYSRNLNFFSLPIVIFWLFAISGMVIGASVTIKKGFNADHHSMAYAFTAFVSVGLAGLLRLLTDAALKRLLFWLCFATAIFLWVGFLIYLTGDVSIAQKYKMYETGDVRYTGWSVNANQIALFFVPLPIWAVGLWRYLSKPTRWQVAGYGSMLFALVMMGLLIRSDGLFAVWVFEIFLLIAFRIFFGSQISNSTLLIYGALIVICVFLVKTIAHGEVRKSVHCVAESIYSAEYSRLKDCYDGREFKERDIYRVGYADPVHKTSIRVQLWQNGLNSWFESHLIGYGPGEYSWHYSGDDSETTGAIESHNITIDLLTQGGLLAGFSWLFLCVYILLKAWRVKDFYSFSVVVMMFLFTFFHNTRQPYLWFVLAFSYEAILRKLFVSSVDDDRTGE